MNALRNPGVRAGLLAAMLFGAATPLAKLLLDDTSPLLLAGLLYTGSGIGLGVYRVGRRTPRVKLPASDRLPLAGAVLVGGLIAPVLLLIGLDRIPASGASLLLNAEAVFTAALAWLVFRENVDRRVAAGMLSIVAGAVVLAVSTGIDLGSLWPSLAVLGACACWGLDNNLTRKLALNDATWLAAIKGGAAGPTNLALAAATGASLPAASHVAAALVMGFFAYGVSLALFIVALRQVGTARAGAYFSIAPFFGGFLAVLLGEPVTGSLLVAGALMALGVWLHLAERHEHVHSHPAETHTHRHTHDEHHEHEHDGTVVAGVTHTHEHSHEELTHAHRHYPDSHHRHAHEA
jgi:drug/metabolite transporter (DMT)-like permease